MADGDLAIAGSFSSTSSGLTVAGSVTVSNIGSTLTDLYFAKLDKNAGTGLWVRAAGSSTSSESATGLTLAALPDGAKGTAAPGNTPGTRNGFGAWLDAQRRLWIFGGFGYGTNISGSYLGDLWRYDPTTNQWTWMSGSGTAAAGPFYSGSYGTQGRPAGANAPGFRQYPASWTDAQGRLWMHGGIGFGAQNLAAGDLSDLWFYDTTLNQWAWVRGPQFIQNNGVYGTLGTPSAANLPGAREQAGAFVRSGTMSNLWLFGGLGYLTTGNTSTRMNDVWTFTLPNIPGAATTLAATAITDTTTPKLARSRAAMDTHSSRQPRRSRRTRSDW